MKERIIHAFFFQVFKGLWAESIRHILIFHSHAFYSFIRFIRELSCVMIFDTTNPCMVLVVKVFKREDLCGLGEQSP
jgi:hypothetical protein